MLEMQGSGSVPVHGPEASSKDWSALQSKIDSQLTAWEQLLVGIQPGQTAITEKQLLAIDKEIVALRQGGGSAMAGPLFQRLEAVHDRLVEVNLTEMEPERPLVGKPIPLSKIADTYPDAVTRADGTKVPADVKTGLGIIGAGFQVQPVKGDGHCLYRALAYPIVASFANGKAAEQSQFLEKVLQTMDGLKKAHAEEIAGIAPTGPLDEGAERRASQARFEGVTESYEQFTKLLTEVQQGKITVDKLFNTQETSDAIVKFFRELACECNLQNLHQNPHIEAYKQEAARYSGTFAKYDKDQRDMTKAEMGGFEEAWAISDAFGLPVVVKDAKACGAGRDFVYPLGNTPRGGKKEIMVLLRPGHYDALVPI